MPKLIKNRAIVEDEYTFLDAIDGALPANVLVKMATFEANREQLLAHAGKLGVQLAADEQPERIVADLPRLALVAIEFPNFADGRGYTYAYLLRERYGFTGEVRAVGDVFRDTMFYQMRCGFDAFAVREDKNLEDALNAFNDFSEAYQASVDRKQPLFRRRLA